MKRIVITYGVALATFTVLLNALEYRFMVRDLSVEALAGILAFLFAGLGVWAGLRLSRRKVLLVNPHFTLNEQAMERLGITSREHEVLGLIATGKSNEEIAETLFVSLSTVKTHISNLFQKLESRRRTEALQKAREYGLIP